MGLTPNNAQMTDMPIRSGADKGGKAWDYVCDFQRAGERLLKGNGRKLWIFQHYLCADVEYKRCLRLFKQFFNVRQDVFDQWTIEVKKSVGRELERVGLYPVDRYFNEVLTGIG